MPSDATHLLLYIDYNHEFSERYIKVDVNYKVNNRHSFDAHCFLRNDIRTFRFCNIISLTNVSTGEVEIIRKEMINSIIRHFGSTKLL